MSAPKPTKADRTWFLSLVPDGPGVVVQPMFDSLAASVNGNMFMGLIGSDVGVRLDPEARARLAAIEGSGEFGVEGRPMPEYVTLPAGWREEPERAAEWVERARRYGASLPPA